MSISRAESLQRQLQIEELMQQGKTTREIAKVIGISPQAVAARLSSTAKISNIRQHQQYKLSQANTSYHKQIQADETEEDEEVEGATPFAAEVTPAEEHKPSFLDKAKAMMGFAPEKSVEPQVQSRKLNKGQQEFVDLVTPIAKQVAVSTSKSVWSRFVDEEKVRILAPSVEDAENMTVPLCRVAARLFSIKYKGKLTPNQIDVMASLAAIAAYSVSSWQLYGKMKKDEQQYGAFTQEEETARSNGHQRGGIFVPKHQAAARPPNRVSLHGSEDENVSAPGGRLSRSPNDAGNIDTSNLTPAQRYQKQALAQLSMQDYQSRLRRSGIAG